LKLEGSIVDNLESLFTDMNDWAVDDDLYTLYNAEDMILGYAFLSIGKGYGGDISILVGLKDSETIKGILILSHQETPGIGTRAMEPIFIDQFIGLSISGVGFTKDGGLIKSDAVTGATVSAAAIINAVRDEAMERVKLIE